jgi:hypothetical protein
MSKTGESATPALPAECRPGVTRARMIIETSDGRAVYFECRDPGETVLEVSHGLDRMGPMDAALAVELPRYRPDPASSVELQIKRGRGPFEIEIRADSGEIPPEVAREALRRIDGVLAAEVVATFDENPLRQLRPYLARIAGTW